LSDSRFITPSILSFACCICTRICECV
jgi:hypothetical protein